MALRDFIYIDKNRLYSLYSQLFEGVVESLVKSVSYSSEENKTERKIEETIIDASVKVQNVLLFDHIYNTLEDKLNPQILEIDSSTTKEKIMSTSIIKVTGYATIEDYERLAYLLNNFNDIGYALAAIQVEAQRADGKTSKNSVEQFAKDNGLYLDKKSTASMVKLIENFHGNSMDIIIEPDNDKLDVLFKAFLNEANLRLTANEIRNLYSHKPCMKWTMVGEVTNILYESSMHKRRYKGAFSDMFDVLNDVDHFLPNASIGDNDTISVAPIAVYIEH